MDYLFHDLIKRGGFSETYNFIRDRSRAVRNDFTIQHETGPLAIECHDRCARFHILAMHLERDSPGFSLAMAPRNLNSVVLGNWAYTAAAVPSGSVVPGNTKTTMCVKDGVDGIWNANWVSDIACPSVRTGRPETITPNMADANYHLDMCEYVR